MEELKQMQKSYEIAYKQAQIVLKLVKKNNYADAYSSLGTNTHNLLSQLGTMYGVKMFSLKHKLSKDEMDYGEKLLAKGIVLNMELRDCLEIYK